ncbi:conserved hypothetical protein [Ricinus communis]|uniref:Secreted protein n=1 Tax=Ricinus communis TaxID=3988 RepID=B9RUA6_RICCO|nr:conserved hypothetical protein [Ricinus communis]
MPCSLGKIYLFIVDMLLLLQCGDKMLIRIGQLGVYMNLASRTLDSQSLIELSLRHPSFNHCFPTFGLTARICGLMPNFLNFLFETHYIFAKGNNVKRSHSS